MVHVFREFPALALGQWGYFILCMIEEEGGNWDLMKSANMISGASGGTIRLGALINRNIPGASGGTIRLGALINRNIPGTSGGTIRVGALINRNLSDGDATNSQPGVFICKTLGEGSLKGRAPVKQNSP